MSDALNANVPRHKHIHSTIKHLKRHCGLSTGLTIDLDPFHDFCLIDSLAGSLQSPRHRFQLESELPAKGQSVLCVHG